MTALVLFSATELATWLHYTEDLSDDHRIVEQIHRVVSGWLLEALEWDSWPYTSRSEVPDVIHAFAVELAGIAWENPTSQTTDSSGEGVSTSWAPARERILARARGWAARAASPSGSTVPSPQASFPAPPPWPDPTVRDRSWRTVV